MESQTFFISLEVLCGSTRAECHILSIIAHVLRAGFLCTFVRLAICCATKGSLCVFVYVLNTFVPRCILNAITVMPASVEEHKHIQLRIMHPLQC